MISFSFLLASLLFNLFDFEGFVHRIFDDDGVNALRDDLAGRVAVRIPALRDSACKQIILPQWLK